MTRYWLMFCCLLFSLTIEAHAPLSNGHTLPQVLLDDFPSEGRSAFDQVMGEWQEDRYVYDVPTRFEDLLAKLDQLGETERVLIPLGRSLQRPFSVKITEFFDTIFERFWSTATGQEFRASPEFLKRNRALFDPFQFPRVVVSLRLKDQPSNDPIYLGFIEPYNQIEVISLNSKLGRMEFQLVTDYWPGSEPQVKYVKRQKCMRCHVAGGPIFTPFPWLETNNNPLVRQSMIHSMARSGRLSRSDEKKLYRAIDIEDPQPREFEETVKFGSQQILPSMVWSAMCSGLDSLAEVNHCKRRTLVDILMKDSFAERYELGTLNDPGDREKVFRVAALPLFPQIDPFASYRESADLELLGRDFEENPEKLSALAAYVDANLGELIDQARTFDSEVIAPETIAENSTSRSFRHLLEFSWAVHRQLELTNGDIKSAINGLSADERRARFTEAVAAIPDEVINKDYFDAESMVGPIHDLFLGESSVALREGLFSIENRALPAGLLHKTAEFAGDLRAFGRSCTGCHTGPSAFPPPFLEGEDDESVRQQVLQLGRLILRYTEPGNSAMPPHRERYTDEDLAAIRSFVQAESIEAADGVRECGPDYGEISLQRVDEAELISDQRALDLFGHYCMQCHGSGSVWPRELDLQSVSGLKNEVFIFGRLRSGSMPNCGSGTPIHGLPSDQERAQMLKWISTD